MTTMTGAVRKTALTTWEGIWYVLQNIALGAGYFGKIPAKKAMSDFGLTEMTGAEHFWYVVQCIAFGAGYFAKIPTAKALSELPQFRSERPELGTLSQLPTPPSMPPAAPSMPSPSPAVAEETGSTPATAPEPPSE
jgi:hypothetical protein